MKKNTFLNSTGETNLSLLYFFALVFAIFVSLFPFHQIAFAQTEPTVEIAEFGFSEDQVVITASKKLQKVKEAPATVYIITEEEIKNAGYNNLEEILHDIPGFDISRGNGTQYSQIYQRGYRSTNTDRTLLYIDGIEENDLWKGVAEISRQYPLSNIKRIEVIYGPASALYGANAFQGIINIITKSGSEVNGIKFISGGGSYNTAYTDFIFGKKIRSVDISLTFRGFKSDEPDYSKYADFDYKPDFKYKTTFEDSINNYLYLNDPRLKEKPVYKDPTQDYAIHSKVSFGDFTIGGMFWDRDEGYGVWYRDQYEQSSNDGKWHYRNAFVYSNYNHNITSKLSSQTSVQFKRHQLVSDSKELYFIPTKIKSSTSTVITHRDTTIVIRDGTGAPTDTLTFTIYDTTQVTKYDTTLAYWDISYWHVLSKEFAVEQQFTYIFSEQYSLIGGIEYSDRDVQGEYVYGSKEIPEETGSVRWKAKKLEDIPPGAGNQYDTRFLGIYAQGEISPINKVHITLGGRYDYNRVRSTGGFGGIFNPRAGVVYLPTDKLTIKALVGTAFKDADNWTKFSSTPGRLPAPALKPEKVTTTELNLGYRLSKYFYNDVSVYLSKYKDISGETKVIVGGVSYTQVQPIGERKIYGAEYNAKFSLKKGIYAYLNASYTNPQDLNIEREVDAGPSGEVKKVTEDRRVGDIAELKANIGGNVLLFNNLNLNLRLNWVGERKTVNFEDDKRAKELPGKDAGDPQSQKDARSSAIKSAEKTIDTVDPYFIANFTVGYDNLLVKGLDVGVTVNNLLNAEYFDPGVRSANGDYYATKCPQPGRNILARLQYKW